MVDKELRPKGDNNVMLDLETMDNTSDSAIVSIGACVFSSANGITSKFEIDVDLQSAIDYGGTVGGSTVLWWLNQKWEARKKLTQAKALLLPDALIEFSNWIPDGAIVWGNGSDFDNVILKNAYRRVDMPTPWPKFNDRCFRTMKTIFKDVQKPKREGIAHSALDDAIFQATWILKIFEEKFKCRATGETECR